MDLHIRDQTAFDRKIPGKKVIAVVDHLNISHPIVRIEQADWVKEVHVARENGDSKYGYVLYLPASGDLPKDLNL